MKTSFKILLAVASFAVSASAMATSHHWQNDRGPDRYHHAPPAAKWSDRQHDRSDYARFRQGDRLPKQYRDNRYHVSNWRNSRLSAPPRGYHWVRADHRYLLVSNYNHRIYQVR
ncbi:RcnB family protein [Acinetobacter ihumii]|uniref:RcnB family protein n=1 Tax=Acinetobacter ihumii TaxID=2483802 RepID=UPI00102F327B|nr:RcnB family protein [Acinetobacter ihumii]